MAESEVCKTSMSRQRIPQRMRAKNVEITDQIMIFHFVRAAK